MIPLTLYVRNFMCYREQTLDFRGIHLACLTGDNGHGKSAILDAMTWAIWGYSRLGARRDDELIHLGQTEMEVEFEFALLDGTSPPDRAISEQGIRYRIIRKRSMGKRSQSNLELQGWDAQEKKFRPLTEPTIARTQQQINVLLRMDYDTFINSAFLLQGRADEFTIKRAAERKRVLGDILGLEIYDRYEKLARDAAQERRERGDQLLASVEQIDRELAREPEYRADALEAEAELTRLQAERTGAEEAYEQIRAQLQEAQSAQRQLGEVERRMASIQDELDRIAHEITSHHDRLQALETALTEEAEIETGYQTYQQAGTDNEAMNSKLAESASLKEQRSEIEQRIANARHKLELQRLTAAQEVQQLEKASGALEQQAEWQELQAALARLDDREAEKEGAQAGVQALSTEIAAMQADNKRAEQDAAQIKEKIDLLSRAEGTRAEGAPDEQAAHCPLCGQPLAENNCAQLRDTFQEQLEAERSAYRERNAQINTHTQRIRDLQAALTQIDRDLRGRSGLQRQEAAQAHRIEEARTAYEALPPAQEKLQAFQAALAEGDYAPQESEALHTVEQQLRELGYDADAHRRIQADLDRLRPYEEQMQTLREARYGLEPVRQAIAQLKGSRTEAETRLIHEQALVDDLQKRVQHISDLQRQAMENRHVLESAHDREQQASLRLGAARNKVDYCADLKRQRVKRLKEEKAFREEQAIYQELQRAFGKNGVQAMLIESAIPDIEEEANHLLARMTRGRMHVRFETQRDTKAGNTVETLDIHITDELGTRSYETYSGGERYRINFAIRIALSKLLSRQAGAQLQMLVIDEGFGTQDSEGRDGLIDAINAIRDDFACILVITHIEELRNAFNVRIEVNKTAQGSEITVI